MVVTTRVNYSISDAVVIYLPAPGVRTRVASSRFSGPRAAVAHRNGMRIATQVQSLLR
jgi:hypothetical protein